MIIKIFTVTLLLIGVLPFFSFAIFSLMFYPFLKDSATSPFLRVGDYSIALMPMWLSLAIVLSFLTSFVFSIIALFNMEIIHG